MGRQPKRKHPDRAIGEPPPSDDDQASEPPESDDFAAEHTGATFADQLEGGPEHAPEPESPDGYAGQDRYAGGGPEARW